LTGIPGCGTVPPVTATTGIDTREMIAVHTAFRREFDQAPALVRAVPAGNRARTSRVADHVQLALDMLHHHHTGEDRLLWPKLLERVPAELAPTVELMERQHEGVHAELVQATAALERWRAGEGEVDRDELAASLERLTALLIEHLAAEEERILPLAAQSLTQAEWDEIGAEGMAGIPKKHLPMVFGMIMADADPEVIRGMLAHAPLLPRLVLPRVAPAVYGRYRRRLTGA
jgi:iron-sulfur cluster repair protein YtfE (RIC family)